MATKIYVYHIVADGCDYIIRATTVSAALTEIATITGTTPTTYEVTNVYQDGEVIL